MPELEGYKKNPHYAKAHPMPVWRADMVARIELGDQWQQWLARSLKRRKLDSVSDLRTGVETWLIGKAVRRVMAEDRGISSDETGHTARNG